jgi:hypothetical protein
MEEELKEEGAIGTSPSERGEQKMGGKVRERDHCVRGLKKSEQ